MAGDAQRLIALPKARIKWLTGKFFLHSRNAFFEIPPSQKVYQRGCTMYEHCVRHSRATVVPMLSTLVPLLGMWRWRKFLKAARAHSR